MKKILSFIIIAVLCLGVLSSCDVINGLINPTPEHTHNYVGGVCECGEVDPNATFYPERAAEYIVTQYNKENPVTAADYEVYGQVRVGGVVYTVDWSVDNELVKLVDNGSTWLVNVDEKSESEQAYKLTGLITAPDGSTATVSFDRTVPEYAVISFEEYMAAKDGDIVTVEGIVVGINGLSLNNKYNHLYLMDASGEGGYYCYKLKDDPAKAGIKIGMTVSVSGEVSPYSGMQEIYGGTFQIVDETIKTITPVDITTNFAAGEPLTNFVAMPVVIKGVTIGAQDLEKDTSQYLYFSIGDEKGYVRTYVSDFINLTINKEGDAYTSPDKATIDAAHAEKFGWTANVTGILVLYGVENPYIIPTSVDCFEYLEFVEKTADEKIAAELEGISLPEAITENTTLTLPLVGQYYNDVKIAWTVDNTAYTVGEDGKLEIKLGAEKVTLTLTATLTCGDKTETKTLEVAVDAAATDLYIPKFVDTVKDGDTFKLAMYQAKLGKYLYFNGQTAGYYLGVTDKAADAADVHVEAVEGGLRFYVLDGETKNYIEIYQNGDYVNIKLTAEPTCVFVYDETAKTYVVTIGDKNYYLGTYGDKTDLRCSATSYITGDNAANVGVSQHVAAFATLASADYAVEAVTPEAGKSFKLAMYQAKLGKYLYFNGKTAGYYLGVTDKTADAADVYAEAVEGGLRFYVLDGETKNYIEIYQNGDYVNIKLTTEPTCVFAYDETAKTYVVTIGDKNYYLGTYGDKTDIRCSATSYITGDNAANVGVSQHVAFSAALVLKEVAPKAVETIKDGDTFKLAMYQAKLGKYFYFNGQTAGYYLGITDKISQAADVHVEAVEGGFRFYVLDGETKNYIEIYQNGDYVNIKLTTEPTCVFVYDETAKTYVVTIGEKNYYLGTYGDKTDIRCSATSYITGDNAANVGVSQHVAFFATIEFVVEEEDKEEDDTPVVNPECTIPEALEKEDGTDVVITGKVVETKYDSYNKCSNATIADDNGAEIYIYKLSGKAVVGDVITVTGKVGSHEGAKQIAAGATFTIVTAHTCEYDAATCVVKELCKYCGAEKEGSVLADHNFGETGLCVCGLRKFADGVNVADLESFTKGDGKDASYASRENAAGWTLENGRCDEQTAWAGAQQITINGKTSAVGKLTSSKLTGGIKALYVDYGYAFSESNGVSIKINIKNAAGEVVATTDIVNADLAQNTSAQFVWTLDTAIEGEFVIEIVNNCPSNSTSNKDRYTLFNLAWENV